MTRYGQGPMIRIHIFRIIADRSESCALSGEMKALPIGDLPIFTAPRCAVPLNVKPIC